jgi:4-amino-4-deoxy-L-arabinose transferase-like glycosyltransferase
VLANALSRYMLSHTLATDDAPASLLAQDFHLGYVLKHPPLWEWLLWSIQQFTGPGIESHLLLRYGGIFLMGIAIFRASRVVSGDIRWSAVLALCSPLFYQMGWPFFDWGTHTLILLVICLFILEIALQYVARPTIRVAALLGLLVGLGFLAKYGYAIFLLALFLALVVQRSGRAALLRRETLIVPIVAVTVLSPFLYWIIEPRGDLIAMTQNNLIRTSAPHFERVATGLITFTKSSLNFLMPWLPIAAFAVWYGRRSDSAPMAPMGDGERSAGLTFFSLWH